MALTDALPRLCFSKTVLPRVSQHYTELSRLSAVFSFLLVHDSTEVWVCEGRSVMSNSLRPNGLYSPGNSPGQNTAVGSLSLLQGIFPTQGSKPGLPHCRRILYQLSHREACHPPKHQCPFPQTDQSLPGLWTSKSVKSFAWHIILGCGYLHIFLFPYMTVYLPPDSVFPLLQKVVLSISEFFETKNNISYLDYKVQFTKGFLTCPCLSLLITLQRQAV